MRGLGGRPAPQQHVKPDSEVDEGNEPQPRVERSIERNQDDRNRYRYSIPHQAVVGLGPDTGPVHLLGNRRETGYLMVADAAQHVADLDAGAGARPGWLYSLSLQVAIVLDPPDAVVRGLEVPLFLVVNPAENARRHRDQRQHNGDKADLEVSGHRTVRRDHLTIGRSDRQLRRLSLQLWYHQHFH